MTRILPYKDRIVDPALYGRKGVSENPHSHIFSILYLLKTPVNFWLHAVSKRYKIITLALNGLMNSQLHDPHCVKSVQIRSFFWAVVSRIRTEYREIRSISQYSVRMRKNTDQKKLRIWTLFTQGLLRTNIRILWKPVDRFAESIVFYMMKTLVVKWPKVQSCQ